jgi:hypothetical protein
MREATGEGWATHSFAVAIEPHSLKLSFASAGTTIPGGDQLG